MKMLLPVVPFAKKKNENCCCGGCGGGGENACMSEAPDWKKVTPPTAGDQIYHQRLVLCPLRGRLPMITSHSRHASYTSAAVAQLERLAKRMISGSFVYTKQMVPGSTTKKKTAPLSRVPYQCQRLPSFTQVMICERKQWIIMPTAMTFSPETQNHRLAPQSFSLQTTTTRSSPSGHRVPGESPLRHWTN